MMAVYLGSTSKMFYAVGKLPGYELSKIWLKRGDNSRGESLNGKDFHTILWELSFGNYGIGK